MNFQEATIHALIIQAQAIQAEIEVAKIKQEPGALVQLSGLLYGISNEIQSIAREGYL